MALFEVFIPASSGSDFDMTLRIEAQTWTQALSAGLQKTVVDAKVESLLCDVTENGMEVTDPASGAVFRIAELGQRAVPRHDRLPSSIVGVRCHLYDFLWEPCCLHSAKPQAHARTFGGCTCRLFVGCGHGIHVNLALFWRR